MSQQQGIQKKKALVFFHHNLYPPTTGAHQRALQQIKMLKSFGYQVSLLSSIYYSDKSWNRSSLQAIKKELDIATFIHKGTAEEFRQEKATKNWPTSGNFIIPKTLQLAFTKVLEKVQPELTIINYANWAALTEQIGRSSKTIVDTHDLVSVNRKMQALLAPFVHPTRQQDTIADKNRLSIVTREDFFQGHNLTVDDWELQAYDQFDYALFIAEKERSLVAPSLTHARTIHLPLTQDVVDIDTHHLGNPMFIMGPNYFNYQGYLFFAYKVLPYINQCIPYFCLDVVGSGTKHIKTKLNEIRLIGAIPMLEPVYQQARYAISPLIGGTGQQVKIVEAMAYGVPVVVLNNLAASSPIEHGINGFIARDAQEFAEYCCRLYLDIDLCKRMGQAARECIKNRYSTVSYVPQLAAELFLPYPEVLPP